RTELTISNWETNNKVPLEASLLMKQNCVVSLGLKDSLERILDQQGIVGYSNETIEMSNLNGAWGSNFHRRGSLPLGDWNIASMRFEGDEIFKMTFASTGKRRSVVKATQDMAFQFVDSISSTSLH